MDHVGMRRDKTYWWRKIWIRRPKRRILKRGWRAGKPIARPVAAGNQTSEQKLRAEITGAAIMVGGRRILLIGARGDGIGVTRVTADTIMIPSAPSPPKTSKKSNKPYSSVAIETPVEVGCPRMSAPRWAGPLAGTILFRHH